MGKHPREKNINTKNVSNIWCFSRWKIIPAVKEIDESGTFGESIRFLSDNKKDIFVESRTKFTRRYYFLRSGLLLYPNAWHIFFFGSFRLGSYLSFYIYIFVKLSGNKFIIIFNNLAFKKYSLPSRYSNFVRIV